MNNFLINKKKKKERTVEDIIEYDKTNIKYAPFINKIIDSIIKERNIIKKGNDLSNLAYKLSDICIKIKKKHKFIPRPVQILAILRLADSVFNGNNKGSIGEIKTGEGKSFIVSTLAILLCQFDKKIDIITSNIELASRDQKEQENNFKLFGITSGVLYKTEEKEYLKGNNSYNLKLEYGYDLDVFKRQIVYSTNSNFEFVYLNSMFVCNPLRPYERKYDIVIVDEVDNMFIDQGTSPALLSESCDISYYKDILNVIYYNREKRIDVLHDFIKQLFLGWGYFNTKEGLKKIIDLKKAALSSDKKIRDIDYIVQNGKVIIIDSHTGLKKPESKWTASIHEMVEIKEGMNPSHHSVTYTAVTQHDFFNLYNKILGVTGTVGTDKDRKDLKSIYGVEIFKCPRHFLREKTIYRTKRPEGLDNIFIALNKEISEIIKNNRPVLVIMDSIRNVDDYVTQCPFKNISTIKGINPDEDEHSRNIAGKEGKVTIATSAAGRGVDIKLSKISEENGGLHVIIPFLMPNQRALEQAAGRCGRQGQPGSVNIYYSEEDYYLMSKAFDIKEHNLWITQNKLVEYLHNNYSYLFEGKGELRIPDIEIPFCMPITDVLKMCSFKISKVGNLFGENEDKILDYLMDMIKLTWGLLFNELTHDNKCENLEYCESRLNEYLNYLNIYFPEHLQNKYTGKEEMIKQCQNKLEQYQKFSKIAFGLLKLTAYGLSMLFCPQFTPLIIGGVNVGEEIFNALMNKEDINWCKVFVKFGEGCLEGGIPIKSAIGKQAIDFIASPIFEYAEAKIDGKDFNLLESVNRKLLDKAALKFTEYMNKNIRKPIEDALKDFTFNNEGFKKMIEKLNDKIKDKKVLKNIKDGIKHYMKNFYKSYQEESDRANLYLIARTIEEATDSHLIGNSNIEDELFENTLSKANKKNINDFVKKKYNERKNNSSKDDINNGLKDLMNH